MAELVEDFNDTTYAVAISGNWARSTRLPHSGAGCFKSATINDNGTSNCTVTVPAGATSVRFWYKVSSESTYDFFHFLIAGQEQEELTLSGNVSWRQSNEYVVEPGQTLTFRYTKDVQDSSGDDAAYIDDLTFTVQDDPPPRSPAVSQAAVHRASRW